MWFYERPFSVSNSSEKLGSGRISRQTLLSPKLFLQLMFFSCRHCRSSEARRYQANSGELVSLSHVSMSGYARSSGQVKLEKKLDTRGGKVSFQGLLDGDSSLRILLSVVGADLLVLPNQGHGYTIHNHLDLAVEAGLQIPSADSLHHSYLQASKLSSESKYSCINHPTKFSLQRS